MNIRRRLIVVLMIAAMLVTLLPAVFASASDDAVTAKGYMVGNSLTMSMSPRRFAALLATQDYKVTLGGQLNGDTSLPEQVGYRPVGGGEFDFIAWRRHQPNTNALTQSGMSNSSTMSSTTPGLNGGISGHYFTALSKSYFDFVTLQTYSAYVNTPEKWEDFHYNHTVTINDKEYYEYNYLGDRQAIGIMIDFATKQKRENGTGADTFLIFESWTRMDKMMGKSFYEYYNAPYYVGANIGEADILANTVLPKKEGSDLLMSGLREDFANLGEDAIRLVPTSAIFAELDKMIREGTLPGFKEYMERNSEYYLYARQTSPGGVPAPLTKEAYVQDQGIFNLFVDSVHMACYQIKYPQDSALHPGETYSGWHSGEREGTLASYITAVALYSVLTGYSPVGLPVDMNTTDRKAQFAKADSSHDARLDTVLDAELIYAVQEVIFKVLCENEYTGVTEDAPQRTAASTGHINGNGNITAVATEILTEAPARVATEIALTISENPVWTPANAPVAAPVENVSFEGRREKEE